MRKTLKKAKTPPSVAPTAADIPAAQTPDQAEPAAVPRQAGGPDAVNDKVAKAARAAKAKIRRAEKAERAAAEPAESMEQVRAELADLTTRIQRERTVRCLPGHDFALDTATGRLIRADIERLRSIDPAAVAAADTLAYFVDLRNVCRRLLAEVCFGDSPNRRQSPARNSSKVGRQMMPREHFACLDGPASANEEPTSP